MSQISNCYWFDTIAEVQALNGNDIGSNGSGWSFLESDVIFVYYQGELMMYLCVGYEIAEVLDELPERFTTFEREGIGYPLFIWVNIDYTTTGSDVYRMNSTSWPSSADWVIKAAAIADRMKLEQNGPWVSNREIIAYEAQTIQKDTIDTEETGFTEEAGATLEWLSNGVGFEPESGDGKLPFEIVGSASRPAMSETSIHVRIGLRNNPRVWMYLYGQTGGCWWRSMQVNNDGTNTIIEQSTTISPQSANGGVSPHIRPVTGDMIAWGDQYYTGSKTNQGRIKIAPINADYTMGTVQIVDSPVPTRNGYMGKAVGLAVADHTTNGEETHIITGVIDEIYFMSSADNYATWTLITALDRNDYAIRMAGGRNHAWVLYWDDSIGVERQMYLYYNGSTWVVAQTNIVANANYYGMFISDSVMWEVQTGVGNMRQCGSGYPTILRTLQTSNTGNNSYPVGYYNVYWGCSLIPTYISFGSYTEVHVWEWDGSFFNTTGYYTDDPQENFWLLWLLENEAADGNVLLGIPRTVDDTIDIVYGDPSASGTTYKSGHFYFKTAPGNHLVIPQDFDSHSSAAINVPSLPTNSEVRYAYSKDGGNTWHTYASGTNLQLASLADVKVNGSLYTTFTSAMSQSNPQVGDTYEIVIAINRPATVADDETPRVAYFSYTYNSNIADRTFIADTNGWDGIVDRRIEHGLIQVQLSSTDYRFIGLEGKKLT